MNLLSFSFEDNVFECTRILLEELCIPISRSSLRDRLVQHPDYPSLNAVSETLTSIGISNISVKANTGDISTYPRPFVVPLRQTKGKGADFTVVKDIKESRNRVSNIVFLDTKTLKWKEEPLEAFKARWKGSAVMLVDASECHYTEKSYSEKQRKERIQKTSQYLPFIVIILAVLLLSMEFLFDKETEAFPYIAHTVLAFLGIVATYAIVMHEIGQDLPGIQQLCGAGKKINCAAVLDSKAAKISGIGWGEIGFTYFLGNLLFVIFSGVNNPSTFFILAWLNLLSLPYTLFSVYYQWRIVRQWCPLCLTVQGIIVGQFLLSWLTRWEPVPALTVIQIGRSVFWLGLAYLVPTSLLLIALPLYRNYVKYKRGNDQLGRILRTPSVLGNMLALETPIKGTVENLGIRIGSETAKHTIAKVCNPYCGPCAKTHKVLEEILSENDNVSLRIIFTATASPDDYRNKPVRHFLALAEVMDGNILSQALDDWYGSPQKDYAAFAAFAKKYPVKDNTLSSQDEKIRQMDEWCRINNIKATPTIYLDGYSLPENIILKQIQYI
ncbi:MAG: vitamin K epoxide reductase family protein [Niabella sp.]